MGSGSSNLHNLSPEEKSFIAADLKRKYEELALSGITEAERYEALAIEHEKLIREILERREGTGGILPSVSMPELVRPMSGGDASAHHIRTHVPLHTGGGVLAKSHSQEISPRGDQISDLLHKARMMDDVPMHGEADATPTTKFRKRRLTLTEARPEFTPVTHEIQKRTSIFASHEIGVRDEKVPPFTPEVVGTFSCHGIEPEYSENDEEIGVIQKINQDRGCMAHPFNKSRAQALFMVLDGHGSEGNRVSEFVMRTLVHRLEHHRMTDPNLSFKNSFEEVNEELRKTDIKSHTSGTTCVALYMTGMDYWLAHAGDSRAVLAREEHGKLKAIDLTRDHKPDLECERERILAAGGFVKDGDEETPSARVYLDKECKRVGLAVSRSIGDFIVKGIGVSAEPEVNQYSLHLSDRFVIMASDGVWEFLSSQEAVDIVNNNLDSGSERACQVLIETAMDRWKKEEGDYRDDITAIVIRLPLPFQESIEALTAAMMSPLLHRPSEPVAFSPAVGPSEMFKISTKPNKQYFVATKSGRVCFID